MSIFAIIGLSISIATLFVCVAALALLGLDKEFGIRAVAFIIVIVSLICIFVGVFINTEAELIYIAEYEAQKTTIEQSLESASLTGFERADLVKKAAELNGELAARKSKYERWYYVMFGKNVYNKVEFVSFN